MPQPPLSTATLSTTVAPRATTLSGRAAECLRNGALDPQTLMEVVCQVRHLQPDAAIRMADALLGHRAEFQRLPTGHWALRDPSSLATSSTTSTTASISGVPGPASQQPTRTPLNSVDFAVVDVETTGTRAGRGDRITEIAIASVDKGQVGDVYVQLVNPDRPIPPYITQLTHITYDMVRDQPRFADIAPRVTSQLTGRIFTAHNVAFDWRFVSEELVRASGNQLFGPKLCTVRMARALLPQLSRRSLDHVTRYFGIEITSRHRAAGDALATAQALVRMLAVAQDIGIECWEELEVRVQSPSTRRSSRKSPRRRALPMPVTNPDIVA